MMPEQKEWIDSASYEILLRQWRFAPAGNPAFQGDDGKYYMKVMFAKRDADFAGAVQASKKIGWGGN